MIELGAMNCHRLASCQVDELKGGAERWNLEPKLDGFRLITHVRDGHVESWTRSMKPQAGKIPYIDQELLGIFGEGTVLDGEICALQETPDGIINDFEHVQSVMLSKPDRAVQRANEVRPLDYYVFDVMYLAGQDLRDRPFIERRAVLERLLYGQPLQRLTLVPTGLATQMLHDSFCEMGFEGTVAKYHGGMYESGKRSRNQLKLKTQVEVDAVIVDVKPGRPGSDFDGLVGALIFGQPLSSMPTHIDSSGVELREVNGITYVVRGQCSGVTMTERLRLTKIWKEAPDTLWGTMFAFGHMGKYPEGVKFRHPQFKKWRPDKDVASLVWYDA
jgi:ATP-dependent DNA ligase